MSNKAVVFLGVVTGTLLFLVIATLWAGSPIQDAVSSAHGHLLNKPTSTLTVDQILNLSDLVAKGAVLPAESLLQKITDFYGTIINLLISIWAALGVIAYMYIKTQSEDFARTEADATVKELVSTKFSSNDFAVELQQICRAQFESVMREFANDHSSSLEQLDGWQKIVENKFSSFERRLASIEKSIGEADNEESDGQDLDIK